MKGVAETNGGRRGRADKSVKCEMSSRVALRMVTASNFLLAISLEYLLPRFFYRRRITKQQLAVRQEVEAIKHLHQLTPPPPHTSMTWLLRKLVRLLQSLVHSSIESWSKARRRARTMHSCCHPSAWTHSQAIVLQNPASVYMAPLRS